MSALDDGGDMDGCPVEHGGASKTECVRVITCNDIICILRYKHVGDAGNAGDVSPAVYSV